MAYTCIWILHPHVITVHVIVRVYVRTCSIYNYSYKWDQTYSCTITLLRFLLSFSLLRSAIQCIRGARSSKGQPVGNPIPSSCGRLSGVSLTYTKSVLFPYPLSSCSPLFISLIFTLHYYIIYFNIYSHNYA